MNSLNENQIIEKNNENEITNELNDQNYDNKNINEENIIDNDNNNNINFLLMDEIQILDYLTENKIDENIISQIKELN